MGRQSSNMRREITPNTLEFDLFQDFWDFRQEFYSPQTDIDFETIVAALNDRMGAYIGTPLESLARAIFMVHLEDTEARWKMNNAEGR